VSAQGDLPLPPEPIDGVTPTSLADKEQAIRWFTAEQAATVPLLERMTANGLHNMPGGSHGR
jgi:hypothetical protein